MKICCLDHYYLKHKQMLRTFKSWHALGPYHALMNEMRQFDQQSFSRWELWGKNVSWCLLKVCLHFHMQVHVNLNKSIWHSPSTVRALITKDSTMFRETITTGEILSYSHSELCYILNQKMTNLLQGSKRKQQSVELLWSCKQEYDNFTRIMPI